MFLFKTSKAEGHFHVGYVPDQVDGVLWTSFDSEHAHKIILGDDDKYYISTDEGHYHEMEALDTTSQYPAIKDDNEQAVGLAWAFYKQARDYESDSRDMAIESLEFYQGNQWEQRIRAELNATNRACLVVNQVEGMIDMLSGYARQNRMDWRFFPIEEGDSKVAEVLTTVSKNIANRTNLSDEEIRVFEDSAILGRGFFHVYVDHDSDIRGDIKIEHFPALDAYIAPHEKHDMSDCEYIVKSKWFSLDKLKSLFPDSADKFDSLITPTTYSDEDTTNPNVVVNASGLGNDPDVVSSSKKEIRVLELERKVFYSEFVALDNASGKQMRLIDVPSNTARKFSTVPNMNVIERVAHIIRITKVAGTVLLDDAYSNRPFNGFSLVPVYCKKQNNLWWGKIELVKDVQREINKRHSQATDILNRVAAYGWFYDDQTFRTTQEEDSFRLNSCVPGFMQKIADIGRVPQMVQGVKMPSEIVNLLELSYAKFREITNVNTDMMGMRSNAESGTAIAAKQRQGLIGNEFLFDNFRMAKRRLGQMVVSIIQKLYTPERIIRLLISEAGRNPGEVTVDGQQVQDPELLQSIQQILQNADLLNYDVEVGEGSLSPTARQASFIQWLDAAKTGFPVPPQLLLELSDLPNKRKVKEQMDAMQQQQQEMEQAKIQSEVVKSSMGGSKRPPPQQ